MKKSLSFILTQLKYFFINPFWRSWLIILVVIASLVANGFIWYWYFQKFQDFVNVTPIAYSTAVILLNIFLANLLYPKEKMMSGILLGVGLLIQLFIIFFLRIAFFASF